MAKIDTDYQYPYKTDYGGWYFIKFKSNSYDYTFFAQTLKTGTYKGDCLGLYVSCETSPKKTYEFALDVEDAILLRNALNQFIETKVL